MTEQKFTVDNIGDRQHSMIMTVADHKRDGELVPSVKYLCAYEDVSVGSGYDSLNALVERGLVEIVEDEGSPTGKGAIDLTYTGLYYVAVFGEGKLKQWALSEFTALDGKVEPWLIDSVSESVHSTLLYLIQ